MATASQHALMYFCLPRSVRRMRVLTVCLAICEHCSFQTPESCKIKNEKSFQQECLCEYSDNMHNFCLLCCTTTVLSYFCTTPCKLCTVWKLYKDFMFCWKTTVYLYLLRSHKSLSNITKVLCV